MRSLTTSTNAPPATGLHYARRLRGAIGQAPSSDAGVLTFPAGRGVAVRSHSSGRVRLGVPGLRGDAARALALTTALRELPGVVSVDASPQTGSVVVCYDPAAMTVAQFHGLLALCDARASGAPMMRAS